MAQRIRTLSVIIALGLALNLVGCAQTGTTQTGTQVSPYQQNQKMIWSTDPQGSGQSTDWDQYMDSQGGGR